MHRLFSRTMVAGCWLLIALALVAPSAAPAASAGPPPPADQAPATTQDFQDVPPSNPFFPYLRNIYGAGIVNGYDCGGPGEPCLPPDYLPYYRPNGGVTRIQMAKFVDLARRTPGIRIDTQVDRQPLYVRSGLADGVGLTGASTNGTGVVGRDSAGGTGVAGSSASGSGLLGESATGDGVHGKANSAGHSGVFGENPALGNGVAGVSALGTGVLGQSSSGDGVSGLANATGRSGVFGQNPAAGNGVFGQSVVGTGVFGESVNNDGVHGKSTIAGRSGVFGESAGQGNGVSGYSVGGYAGYFAGNVRILGSCCGMGAGTVSIDDPRDPANKVLNQAVVSSPDLKTIYDGVVQLDETGTAWVTLPDSFSALNGEVRYQLTCIGGFAPVYIAQEVQENRFQIAGGLPRLKVSWQVTGIRRDPYALQHPVVPEAEKPANEQGYYLHPEAYGQPPTQDVAHAPGGLLAPPADK